MASNRGHDPFIDSLVYERMADLEDWGEYEETEAKAEAAGTTVYGYLRGIILEEIDAEVRRREIGDDDEDEW